MNNNLPLTDKNGNYKINFAIAGQPKSGTTALAHFLSKHPQICMSYPKEPGYFATDFRRESDEFHGKPRYFPARTPEDYDEHFIHAEPGQILGDASTCYTYSKEASQNIFHHNPNAKIIIMLRHPVEFMHSLHMQYVNETVEDVIDFKKALDLEPERKQGSNIPQRTRCPSYHYYRERIKYADHIQRYLQCFGAENVLIISNEEFKSNNKEVYQKILRFLDVDDGITPDFSNIHGSKSPRSTWINKIVHTMWLKKALYKILGPNLYTRTHKKVNKLLLKPEPRSSMEAQLYRQLLSETSGEVVKLDTITGKNFSNRWGYNQVNREEK